MIGEGTLVQLATGERIPVEEILPGALLNDPLQNRSNEVFCVLKRTIGPTTHTPRQLAQLTPVLLPRGAISETRPSRNLLMSPQQRILSRKINSQRIPMARLVSAKALVSDGQASRISVEREFSYYLLVMNSSCLIIAEDLVLQAVGRDDLSSPAVTIAKLYPRKTKNDFDSHGQQG